MPVSGMRSAWVVGGSRSFPVSSGGSNRFDGEWRRVRFYVFDLPFPGGDDLLHELPESREAIHHLKTSNSHFAKLFDEYHDLDHEVHRIETDVEHTSDEYLEEQKKKRLHLKDQLYAMIREHEASVAG